MRIVVLFFAQARERAGTNRLPLELPEGSSVGDALALVRRAHPRLADLEAHLALAVDGELVRPEAALRDGAELALLPPVSGG